MFYQAKGSPGYFKHLNVLWRMKKQLQDKTGPQGPKGQIAVGNAVSFNKAFTDYHDNNKSDDLYVEIKKIARDIIIKMPVQTVSALEGRPFNIYRLSKGSLVSQYTYQLANWIFLISAEKKESKGEKKEDKLRSQTQKASTRSLFEYLETVGPHKRLNYFVQSIKREILRRYAKFHPEEDQIKRNITKALTEHPDLFVRCADSRKIAKGGNRKSSRGRAQQLWALKVWQTNSMKMLQFAGNLEDLAKRIKLPKTPSEKEQCETQSSGASVIEASLGSQTPSPLNRHRNKRKKSQKGERSRTQSQLSGPQWQKLVLNMLSEANSMMTTEQLWNCAKLVLDIRPTEIISIQENNLRAQQGSKIDVNDTSGDDDYLVTESDQETSEPPDNAESGQGTFGPPDSVTLVYSDSNIKNYVLSFLENYFQDEVKKERLFWYLVDYYAFNLKSVARAGLFSKELNRFLNNYKKKSKKDVGQHLRIANRLNLSENAVREFERLELKKAADEFFKKNQFDQKDEKLKFFRYVLQNLYSEWNNSK